MIRPILLTAAAAAALALAACDQPSVLAKAQTGECYKVTGKSGSLAQPVLAKVACADDAAATTAAADGQGGSSAVCPKSCTGSGAGAGKQEASADDEAEGADSSASGSRSYLSHSSVRTSKAYRSGWGRRSVSRETRSARVNEGLGIDYARVSDTDKSGSGSTQKGGRTTVVEESSQSGGFDTTGRESVRRGYSEQGSTAISSSSSSSASGSSSSAYGYSAAGGAAGGPCCTAAYPVRGPHSPFDRNGFLTWPGKPDYDPRN